MAELIDSDVISEIGANTREQIRENLQVDSMQIDALKFDALTPEEQSDLQRDTFNPAELVPIEEISSSIKNRLSVEILVCPKCRSRNLQSSHECAKCGVVFALYRKWAFERVTGEVRLHRHPQLAKIWERILADYEDEYLHWSFISAARDANCLAYASHKYARILSVAPDEEIARTMKKRIQGLSALPIEMGRRQVPALKFRGVNSLLIALATALILMGLNMHGARNLTGLGASVLAAVLGWRWWATRPN